MNHIHNWKAWLRSRGKDAFVLSLPKHSKLMDVGCGNDSPKRVKSLRNDIFYIGLDVQDYEQSLDSLTLADEYRITTPSNFVNAISSEVGTIDAVISAHNLEHCDNRHEVLVAMCQALKEDGTLYLAYPSDATVSMPSRIGTLNYYDDKSHIGLPPNWNEITSILEKCGMSIEFKRQRYRPLIPFLIGLVLEPWSYLSGRVCPLGSTWALFGFETVIWARKMRLRK